MRRPVLLVGGVALVTVVAGIAVAASASAGTITYEAEASGNTLSGGAHAVDCRRCSDGRRVTGIGLLGSLTFTGVAAERSGPTRLAVTYTAERTRTAQISVNGGVAIAIRFPATRGAGRPATVRITATLAAGDNTVSFGNPTGAAPDVDKLVITTDGTPPTPAPTGTTPGGPATTATASPAPTTTAPAPTTPPATPTTSPSAPGTTPPTTGAPQDPQDPEPEPPATTAPPATTRPPAPPATSPPATAPPPAGNTAFEAEVLAIVNTERAKAGCAAVTSDDRLVAAARAHSADMAARGYFSHTTPEGVEFATRITNAGYRWSSAGENIAKGQRTPAAVMTAWMNSSGHKANILNCGFKQLGVGVAADAGGTLVWTQNFATPR